MACRQALLVVSVREISLEKITSREYLVSAVSYADTFIIKYRDY
jgi:hypothetical protein